MPNVTDNDLDKLFREAADRSVPEFDPQDWEDMVRRLEHEERAAKLRSKSLYTLLAILLIYTLLPPWDQQKNIQRASIFQTQESTEVAGKISSGNELNSDTEIIPNPATQDNDNNNHEVIKKAEEDLSASGRINNSLSQKTEKVNGNINKRAINKTAPESTGLNTPANKTVNGLRQKTEKTNGNINEKAISRRASGNTDLNDNTSDAVIALNQKTEIAIGDLNKKVINKSASENTDSKSNNNETLNELTQTDNGPATGTSIIGAEGPLNHSEINKLLPTNDHGLVELNNEPVASGTEGFSKEVDKAKNMSLYSRSPRERIILMAKVTDADSVIKPLEQVAEDSERPATVIRPDRLTSSQRWFIKVPVSPDFSSIDYGKLGDAGINIGLFGEYNLTRHLSVSTGAIWSKKLYDSKNPDKSYSSGNWTGKASALDGDCRVLDIPINVTYYIYPDRRTNLFVSLGSSSYIMLKEQYVYTVWANQKEYQYEENFSNKNNEWFSMLNLSIGIQQRLSKRFFAQAEPFLKAPVSGVGEGKVNLMSTGIFFSLKYSLNK